VTWTEAVSTGLFITYLTMLTAIQRTEHRIGRMMMKNDLEGMWKKVAVLQED
jgi:hypothetical protein